MSCDYRGGIVSYDYRSGIPIPDVTRDPAPVNALVEEAEAELKAADPLMAGRGDGSTPWTLDSLLEARGERYGKFEHNATIAQILKESMRNTAGWPGLWDDQAECLDMIAVKISRILVGDPNYPDNWDDIAGFASLVANRLRADNG